MADEGHTDASTGSLDGSFCAANASRHRLLTLKTVEQRLEQLDQEIAKIAAEEAAEPQPQVAAATGVNATVETGVVAEALSVPLWTEQNPEPSATLEPSAEPTTTTDRPRSFMAKTIREGRASFRALEREQLHRRETRQGRQGEADWEG